jgi:hypothetical protein
MHREVMDRRVDDAYGSTIQLSQYGIKLLVACFQHYAKKWLGWKVDFIAVVLIAGVKFILRYIAH